MARSSAFTAVPLALVALVVCAPLLVASDCANGAGDSAKAWPCSACTATAFPNDLATCKACVDKPGAAVWACVNDCARAPADSQGSCLACVMAAGANAWACSTCNSAPDLNLRTACYSCAGNPALQQFGWFCQRLAQTPKCIAPNSYDKTTNPITAKGCLGCMAVAGGNQVDNCLRCANTFPTDTARQQLCLDCVKSTPDWTASKCADVVISTLSNNCVAENGGDYQAQCNACAADPTVPTDVQSLSKCAWCTRAGKTGSALAGCMATAQKVDWGFPPSKPRPAKCGDVLVFNWATGTHNVKVVTPKSGIDGTSTKICTESNRASTTVIQADTAASPSKFTTAPIILSSSNTPNVYICDYVGRSDHCSVGNMIIKVEACN